MLGDFLQGRTPTTDRRKAPDGLEDPSERAGRILGLRLHAAPRNLESVQNRLDILHGYWRGADCLRDPVERNHFGRGRFLKEHFDNSLSGRVATEGRTTGASASPDGRGGR